MSENDDTETYVEVWQQPDKMWRWRWVQRTGEETEQLVSYMAFQEMSGAKESAQESYPGIEVRLPEKVRRAQEKREQNTSRKRARRSAKVLLVAGVVIGLMLGRPRRRRCQQD